MADAPGIWHGAACSPGTAKLDTLYFLIGSTMLAVWVVEAGFRRRGSPHPWIYGWAASCLFLSSAIAFFCLRGGWGLAWSCGLALAIGPTAYPLLRNLMEAMRTAPPRRVYVEHREDPPLDAPPYQATAFGSTPTPLRPERAPVPPAWQSAPRVFRWEDANIPEFRRAALATIAATLALVASVAFAMHRDFPSPAGDVAAALAEAGYHAVRVQPAANGDHCPAGRAKPYQWTAPGVEGGACRSNSGRVSYWVVRTWGEVKPR